jgi:hypothetical protein
LRKGLLSELINQLRPPPKSVPGEQLPESSFEVVSGDDVKFDFNKPNSCNSDPDIKDSHGNPIVVCDFIGGDYDEWAEQRGKPFKSKGGCELS